MGMYGGNCRVVCLGEFFRRGINFLSGKCQGGAELSWVVVQIPVQDYKYTVSTYSGRDLRQPG